MTDKELARKTFSRMTGDDRIWVDSLASEMAIRAGIDYIDALVVVMKLGQYFATRAGVKR